MEPLERFQKAWNHLILARSDLELINKNERTCHLVDFAVHSGP